jgi:hypothetical protein
LLTGLILALFSTTNLAAEIPLQDFFEHSKFRDMKLSPDGKHVAFTFQEDSEVKLSILNLEKNQLTSSYAFGDEKQVLDFYWASDNRVVMAVFTVVGNLDDRLEHLRALPAVG